MSTKHNQSHLNCYSILIYPDLLRYIAVGAALFFFTLFVARADSQQTALVSVDSSAEEKYLDDYGKSKGYSSCIVFDSSNIKLFCFERSVLCQDKNIRVFLDNRTNNGFESVPLKIRLLNVNERQDCKVDVIADSQPADFVIMNSKSKVLSKSSAEQPFHQNHVTSSTFHLEDTPDFSFCLKFSSRTKDEISIKKIILSFSENSNSSFLSSPGILEFDRDNINLISAALGEGKDIEFRGKQGRIQSKKCIIVSDKAVETSVKVKNIGDKPTRIYVGFIVYNQNRVELKWDYYPYKGLNNVLTVVSSEAGSNTVIVDSYPDWGKNCYLGLNAENDLLDVPNTTIADGGIVEVKKLADGKGEITMSKPFKTALEKGTKVRIQGGGGGYIYTNIKILQPGEDEVFTYSIKRDRSFQQYSSKAFSRGVYYVRPVLLSYSVDAKEENTVIISDYTVSF